VRVNKGPKGQQKLVIVPSYENTRLAIEKAELVCAHDLFRDKYTINGHAIQQWAGDLTDMTCSHLRQFIIDNFQFDPKKENVVDVAVQMCGENSYHPICDYLDEVEPRWDGTKRIGTWLTRYLGAENTPLNCAIGRLVLLAAARRARVPGCKFDFVLILEDKTQGTGKSSAISILAGEDYFTDQEIVSLDAKTQIEQLSGVWIYELGELEGFKKTQINKIKSFISRVKERARPAYGRFLVERKRQCIFIGSTNESEYLRDTTGNRRFWPVATGWIDLEALTRDRDQIWGEAATIERTGCKLELDKSLWATAAVEQSKREPDDPWLVVLENVKPDAVIDGKQRIKSSTLFAALDIGIKDAKGSDGKRVKNIMHKLGYEGPDCMSFGDDDRARGYQKDEFLY
jgi:predicted P-loop ATPase